MSARDAILARVRRSLGVSGADPARRAVVAERLTRAPLGVIPASGQLPPEERLELFTRLVLRSHAEVERVDADQVPERVVAFLERQNLAPVVSMGIDPRLAAIPWDKMCCLEINHSIETRDGTASVTHAEVGIAETGTVVLVSGSCNPTLLSFLPLAQVILVRAADIVGDPETAMARVQRKAEKRAIHFITGPSRSSDIEQTMYLGAHGPKSVLVLVLE